VDKHKKMSEILRMLSDEKESRPWEMKPRTAKIRRVYTIEMEKDGRYKVIESRPHTTTHHSNFASEEDAEAWAAYRRDSAAHRWNYRG